MDSDSSEQFGFAFLLAVLFHLLLLFLLILSVNFESEVARKKTIEAMQATILEATSKVDAEDSPAEAVKKLSRAEKKRLAYAKRKALRLEQAERKKLLAQAAQTLVIESLQAQKFAQETAAIAGKIKKYWNRPAGTEGITCVIRVELLASGQVKAVSIQKSSGNKLFDISAKVAIHKAAPFQISDDEFVREKILMGFPVYFGNE